MRFSLYEKPFMLLINHLPSTIFILIFISLLTPEVNFLIYNSYNTYKKIIRMLYTTFEHFLDKNEAEIKKKLFE